MEHIFSVVMAGGSGTRFWPLSRRSRPKQYLSFANASSRSLLAATVDRVTALSPIERTLVVTRSDLADLTRQELPDLPSENLLVEPVARNTAPCVAWATATIQRRDPDAIIVLLPSDAFVQNEPIFVDALRTAVEAAGEGALVTLGITPTRPETGYGYLHVGESFRADLPGVLHVREFVEKPDRARAERFLASGEYLWNAGIFVFRANVMRRAVEQHLPDVARVLNELDVAASHSSQDERRLLAQHYPNLPNISIDHGVLEKISGVVTVPVSCGWSDIGSWQAVWELSSKDERDNAVHAAPGCAVLIDASANMVVAPPGKSVTLIGVDNLVIVDTPDALLIVPREHAQQVKAAVEELAALGRQDVL